MTAPTTWMLYGATGYTGRNIAEEAVRRGMCPILAGRDAAKVATIAAQLRCRHRVFSLDRPEAIAEQLAGVGVVVHCAGPFSATAAPMMEACLRAGAHYLDITGEIRVIEAAASLDARAKAAGVVLLPAAGFDVVPSDCLAAMVAAKRPGAVRLELAFEALGRVSPGTMKTMLEALPRGGLARIDGRIERVPAAWKTMEVAFPDGVRYVVSVPWGDVASAYYSTGVPNIETYVSMPRWQGRLLRGLRPVWPLLGLRWVQSGAKRLVDVFVRGPSEAERRAGRVGFWARATDAAGRSATARMTTPEGYQTTVTAALACLERVSSGGIVPGFQTPAKAFGAEFALTLPGISVTWDDASY